MPGIPPTHLSIKSHTYLTEGSTKAFEAVTTTASNAVVSRQALGLLLLLVRMVMSVCLCVCRLWCVR